MSLIKGLILLTSFLLDGWLAPRPWIKPLFQLTWHRNTWAPPQNLIQQDLHFSSERPSKTYSSGFRLKGMDEQRQQDWKSNSLPTKPTSSPDVCEGGSCDSPFQGGSGYCLGGMEVSLADRIQHKGWSVFHGSAAPYDGLAWKAYADTEKNKGINHKHQNKKSSTCEQLFSVLNNFWGWR